VGYIVRPENIRIAGTDEKADNAVEAVFDGMFYFGHFVELVFNIGGNERIKITTPTYNNLDLKTNMKYSLVWSSRDARIVSKPSILEGVDIEDLIYGR
jgi:hypothetical protein